MIKEQGDFVETVREVVNSNTLTSIFNIPATLRNRKVEVIIKLAADEKKVKKLRVSLKGRLKRYANPDKRYMEKDAWAMSVGEKYADS